VLLIHQEQRGRHGGGDGLRDQGLLDSAVAMPRATSGGQFVHESVFAMAGAYAFHIARNQPVRDENERTAVLSAIIFLELNGFIVKRP
jgi:death-on-curing protein